MDVDAIIGAVRGVLQGDLGVVRTVPSTTFAEKMTAAVEDEAAWLRARVRSQVEVRHGLPIQTGWGGPPNANVGVWTMPIDVVMTYAVRAHADLIPARRYTVSAQAAEDAATVQLALGHAGNLTVDESSNATGIVSGFLHRRGDPRVERDALGDEVGLYVYLIPFEAWIQETQAVA